LPCLVVVRFFLQGAATGRTGRTEQAIGHSYNSLDLQFSADPRGMAGWP
jgi:hypothetical protein